MPTIYPSSSSSNNSSTNSSASTLSAGLDDSSAATTSTEKTKQKSPLLQQQKQKDKLYDHLVYTPMAIKVTNTAQDLEMRRDRQANNHSPFPSSTIQKKLFHLNTLKTLRKSITDATTTNINNTNNILVESVVEPSPLNATTTVGNTAEAVAENQNVDDAIMMKLHWQEMQKMKRRDSLNSNSGELYGSLVGNYEESILTGRLSTPPSKPINFVCQIGVLAIGKTKAQLRCPPHVIIPFKASFYEWSSSSSNNSNNGVEALLSISTPATSPLDDLVDLNNSSNRLRSSSDGRRQQFGRSMTDELGTPYVGTVDLEWGLGELNNFGYLDDLYKDSLPGNRSDNDPIGGFRIPLKGRLQILIKNENKTVVKMFLIPYNYREMKPNERTFLRQKCFSNSFSNSLRYALHLQFLMLPSTKGNGKRLYLFKSIRVVFSHRLPEGPETLKIVYETPEGKFGDECSARMNLNLL